MNKGSISILTGLVAMLVLLASASSYSGADRVMLRMKSQSLQGGKAATVEAELFYQSLDGRMITVFEQPYHQVMITNKKGELSVYRPGENTLYRRQSMEYSSENNLVYFFLEGKTHDLGLHEMGFAQTKTEFDNGLLITHWMPPAALGHLFSHIELVHEDYMPIYAGYYDASRKLVKKVYYSNYEVFPQIVLPMTITEFNYLPGGDSIVSRVQFSEVYFNRQAVSSWFDFEIPHDAQILD